MKILPGKGYPLGANFDGWGTNFSIFSEAADKIELCLFDIHGRETRIPLPETSGMVRHGYIPNVVPGTHYGYRIYGSWNPAEGQLCNPAKLLLDPYAKAVTGTISWHDAVFPYSQKNSADPEETDSAPFVPKGVVANTFFDWSDDFNPMIPWHKTVIYEVHVKGFSVINPHIPSELRGTYSGLAHPEAISHFKKLGVTALELMPVHQFVHDGHLLEKGLKNYWGYNTIGFFAPHNEYSAHESPGMQVAEFKQMVKRLHKSGIEVILDVVYNHTAEGNHMGPVLSFKGIDNSSYYRLSPEDKRKYIDYTGTGNSLNMRHPHVLQLIMDSLRYWVLEMHVDGFRFDLASTLARELHDVDRLSSFFEIIQQDPVISQVKLIAEPWDVGEGGYQVGNFPPGWSEWNGKYRDCIRDFWRGQDQTLGEFAYRFTGSSDLYEDTERKPYASVNFITAHDGFTMRDLVSYNDKHNEANGESNRDGESHNRSWNCGAEGPVKDQEILSLRKKQVRNFLITLFLSQGVPMLLHGDEIGRTQGGNNNVYCQDNEIAWMSWDAPDQELFDFTAQLIHFRRNHPVFQRRKFFQGRPIHGSDVDDIGWFTPEGEEMDEENWGQGFAKSIGVFLNGDILPSQDDQGFRKSDDTFYILFNAHHYTIDFALPPKDWARQWEIILDSAEGWVSGRIIRAEEQVTVSPSGTVLMRKIN
ncbi:MAG: glycogen debranching protein GlgX [Spirochaetia bacterium]